MQSTFFTSSKYQHKAKFEANGFDETYDMKKANSSKKTYDVKKQPGLMKYPNFFLPL